MHRVGVLALQGDGGEHVTMLESLESVVVKVRTIEQLESVEALVLPGGESTTIAHLLVTSGLRDVLGEKLRGGFPVFGTCAGLILLSSEVLDGRADQWSYGAMAVSLRRNGYGRQTASFESSIDVKGVGTVSGVFIRAPRILAWDNDVEVLATLDHGDGKGEHPVFVRQENVWGASFHPEMAGDPRLHRLFVDSL
jgi:5'-phosphate synthase pdxT subunit